MSEKVKESEQLSETEISARRDIVIRRMISTPPIVKPKKTGGGKLGRPIAS